MVLLSVNIMRRVLLGNCRHVTKSCHRPLTQKTVTNIQGHVTVQGHTYEVDRMTNVNPRILARLDWRLHNQKNHPINIIRQRIQNFFYSHHLNRAGNPLFSVYDNLSPVVTLEQNFDSLFVPEDHPSRAQSDSFYINERFMLRAHTSAHQRDLIRSGLDAFLVVGDVFRRDAIDRSHFPVFHQMEGVRLYTEHELFQNVNDPTGLSLSEAGHRNTMKQETHTLEAAKLTEHNLKSVLEKMAGHLFGQDIKTRWVEAYFPFTHPSWEMEIEFNGEWLEVLGCGIMEQKLLKSGGAGDTIGWAFGLGLDRLAMLLFDIPDIRIFWSRDSGFLSQFEVSDINSPIKYKPVSVYPQCSNDLSFWIPEAFNENDFYDLVRNVGSDLVEQVTLVDSFVHPKTNRTSKCYRIVYRHTDRTLTQTEVNEIHATIASEASVNLGIEVR